LAERRRGWSGALKALRWALRIIAIGAALIFATSLVPGPKLAPEVLEAAGGIALLATLLALLLDVATPATGGRTGATVRLLLGMPATVTALYLVFLSSGVPGVINRVTAPDGSQYLLGVGPMPTDVDYQLWRSVDPSGLFWERTEDLTWSEDGGFTENPRLVLVRDRWLLVRRGGIWTDCYEIVAEGLEHCGGGHTIPDWQNPDAWRRASAEMAVKVGVGPGEN
jgi:hypothetical protein